MLKLRNQEPRQRGANDQNDEDNSREAFVTVNRANQIDIFFNKYSVTNRILKHFSLTVLVQYKAPNSQLSLSMDFGFNCLRDVQKVQWKPSCPWYCEVRDGLSWFGYCLNRDCQAFRSLFVVNRGYGIFKLENELSEFFCPVCMQENYELRNLGFVNCEWALKGVRKSNAASRIISDGTTYDNKLHTFCEIDYKT